MDVTYKFKQNDRVNTPLVDSAIITMLGYQDGNIKYYIENNVQGVANGWWNEDQLNEA